MSKIISFVEFTGICVIVMIAIIHLHQRIDKEHNYINRGFIYAAERSLIKPAEGYQGALVALPDGSAYVPIIFKDKITHNVFTKDGQGWHEKEYSYFDFGKLVVPKEEKCLE